MGSAKNNILRRLINSLVNWYEWCLCLCFHMWIVTCEYCVFICELLHVNIVIFHCDIYWIEWLKSANDIFECSIFLIEIMRDCKYEWSKIWIIYWSCFGTFCDLSVDCNVNERYYCWCAKTRILFVIRTQIIITVVMN